MIVTTTNKLLGVYMGNVKGHNKNTKILLWNGLIPLKGKTVQ